MPEEIVKYEKEFRQSTTAAQLKMLSNMAWALYATGHYEEVRELLHRDYQANASPSKAFLALVYSELKKSAIEKSPIAVAKAYMELYSQRWVFRSHDYNKMNGMLNFAQILVESEEAINFVKEARVHIGLREKWKMRVKGFNRDALTWDRFISLRNCIVPISENVPFYTKIIAMLRKDREFLLIKRLFAPYFHKVSLLEILFERISLLVALGRLTEAAAMGETWSGTFEHYNDASRLRAVYNRNNIFFQESWLWT